MFFSTNVCLFLKPFTQRTLHIMFYSMVQKYIATLDMEKTITAICNISYMNMNPTMNNRCSQTKKESKLSNVMRANMLFPSFKLNFPFTCRQLETCF